MFDEGGVPGPFGCGSVWIAVFPACLVLRADRARAERSGIAGGEGAKFAFGHRI